jgi:membrane-associated phospholipid phosphatase
VADRFQRRGPAVAAYAVLLLAWSWFVGIPNDPVGVVLWLWLFTVAWHVERPRRTHLQFLADWWRPVLLLAVYWLCRGLADEIGLSVHVTEPIRFDAWLGRQLGGDGAPTVTLQHTWCGTPCARDSEPRWYDVVLTTVYASHFLTGLTLGMVLWLRSRVEWVLWMRRYVVLSFAALVGYIAYPTAPPWMASRDGYLPEVHRITGRGWSEIGLHRQTLVLGGLSNKVAAMPSLHAGIAFLVAYYGIWKLRTPLRWLLLLYPAAMSLALVYFAEHYVLDVLMGGVVALLVMMGCAAWEPQRLPEGVRSTSPGPRQ